MNLLLIIDAQNDFADPKGTLFTPGADKDCLRLSDFLHNNEKHFDQLIMTMDSHPQFHIAHPLFWKKADGSEVEPFTTITVNDFNEGKYKPAVAELAPAVKEYLLSLESRGKFQLTIWPPHCLIGSNGRCIVKPVFDAASSWEKNHIGKQIIYIDKALNPMTEHYSAVQAEVPDPNDERTRTNYYLIDKLKEADNIYVAGECLSHCVGNTLRDLFIYIKPENITLITDCTSSVVGFEEKGKSLLEEFKSKGMKTITSDSIIGE